MEFFGGNKNEESSSSAPEKAERRESLVETKKQEAIGRMCDQLDERLKKEIGRVFESNGREYELTGPEDCMVAYAQEMRNEVEALHKETIAKDDYYEEKATAKLLELFKSYERLVSLYAELLTLYPVAGARSAEYIPSLEDCKDHGNKLWDQVK